MHLWAGLNLSRALEPRQFQRIGLVLEVFYLSPDHFLNLPVVELKSVIIGYLKVVGPARETAPSRYEIDRQPILNQN